MGYPTQIAISLLLFAAFSIPRNVFVQAGGASPWSDTQTAESFMNVFFRFIQNSGIFSADQIDDMQMIKDSLMNSMNKMAKQGKTTPKKLQAMDMAFTSSIAEIAVAEGADSGSIISVISNALTQAYLQTIGSVNYTLINEIKQLVGMFSQLQNSIPESSTANFGNSASASTSASASGAGGYQPGATGGYGAATGGYGAAATGAGTGGGYQSANSVGYQTASSSTYSQTASGAALSQSNYGAGPGMFQF